jgi:hypothetical protein
MVADNTAFMAYRHCRHYGREILTESYAGHFFPASDKDHGDYFCFAAFLAGGIDCLGFLAETFLRLVLVFGLAWLSLSLAIAALLP